MANLMKSAAKTVTQSLELEEALQEARRATGDASSSVLPVDPEVMANARRRQFSPNEKRRILAEADRCTAPGEIGALLRREGIYSSHLANWRRRRSAEGKAGLDVHPRGRKADPAVAEAHRTAKLMRENERLRRQLVQARLIIDVQKKVSTLLALQTEDDGNGESGWTA